MECERKVCERTYALRSTYYLRSIPECLWSQKVTDSVNRNNDGQAEEKIKKEHRESKAEQIIQTKQNENLQNRKKVLRNQSGWNHSWASPNKIHLENGLAVRDVIPGPFISPRLVKVTPFVVNKFKEVDRIRRGIPDAWAEYLAVNGLCSRIDRRIIEKEITLGYNNLKVTDFVWNELGLPLTQGIPDPWKPILLESDLCFGDERADICLCNPTTRKVSKCRIPRERKTRKVKCKLKGECQKCPHNVEFCTIPEKIPKEKKICKWEKKIKKTLPNENSGILPEPKVIQCDISAKITLHTEQGKSFDGIGSLKFNCGQNGNRVSRETQKGESHQYLPDFAHNIYNKFTQNPKVRDIVSNFEPKKQLSKLKNIFNGKKDDETEDFDGEEIKLICCKCSCPYFKVLPEELLADNNLLKESMPKHSKSKVEPKTQTDKRPKGKTEKICCMRESKKNKNIKEELSEEKILDIKTPLENLHEDEDTDILEEGKEKIIDKHSCGCEIAHSKDSIDSGNNADISDFSKNISIARPDGQSPRQSAVQSVTSMTYMTRLIQKSEEEWSQVLKENKKATLKTRTLCDPCGRKPLRKMPKNHNPDVTVDFPSRKDHRKKEESDLVLLNAEDRQRSVSYATEVAIMTGNETKIEKKTLLDEKNQPSKIPKRMRVPSWERAKSFERERDAEERNTQTDNIVIENLSYNSDEDLLFEKDKLKLEDCIQGECRKRWGGFEMKFWPSDLESDKRETRKTAWCEEENKVDSFRKMSEFSSLLEESLDLISEPIGRRRSSENLKIIDEKSSQNENKCYVKYCYDRSKKYNRES